MEPGNCSRTIDEHLAQRKMPQRLGRAGVSPRDFYQPFLTIAPALPSSDNRLTITGTERPGTQPTAQRYHALALGLGIKRPMARRPESQLCAPGG